MLCRSSLYPLGASALVLMDPEETERGYRFGTLTGGVFAIPNFGTWWVAGMLGSHKFHGSFPLRGKRGVSGTVPLRTSLSMMLTE